MKLSSGLKGGDFFAINLTMVVATYYSKHNKMIMELLYRGFLSATHGS